MESNELKLVIEIVCCKGLLIADATTSDPYVKVKLGKKDLHQTKKILKTLNPIYSENTDSSFLLQKVSLVDLNSHGGLIFKVKDWNRINMDETIGEVLVPTATVMESKGEDMELKITPPKKRSKEDAGYITVRIRPAVQNDIKYFGSNKKSGSYPRKFMQGAMQKTSSKSVESNDMASVMFNSVSRELNTSLTAEFMKLKDEDISEFEMQRSLPEEPVEVKKDETISSGTRKVDTSALTEKPVEVKQNDLFYSVTGEMQRPSTEIPLDVKLDEQLSLLVDILSCKGLPAGLLLAPDPYVQVNMGQQKIHKTKYIMKTDHPVFNESHNSSFHLNCSVQQLFDAGSVSFDIFDWNPISKHDLLGTVNIPAKIIYDFPVNKKIDFPIIFCGKNKKEGILSICVRGKKNKKSKNVKDVNNKKQ